MKNLKALMLSDNQLTGIPDELVKLKNLEVLLLSENQLTELPLDIHKMKNLKTLVAIKNKFSPEEKERIKKALPNCKVYL